MKIAIDVAQTCVERAGCGWHADAFARALAKEIGSENVILYHQFGERLTANTQKGTQIEGSYAPFANMPREKAKQYWKMLETGKIPLPGNPDIVHSNSFIAPKIHGAKLVYTIHDLCFWTHPEYGTESNRLTCQSFLLKALKNADAFVFVSEQSKKDFDEILPNWISRSGLPVCVISPFRSPKRTSTNSPYSRFSNELAPLIHIGSIEPRKGIGELLDTYVAYHRLSAKKRPLKLIGSQGWMSDAIHLRIQRLSQRLPISYAGYLPKSKLSQAMDESFALLCSSKYEGYGLPVDEAADFGIPIISTKIPSFQKFRNSSSSYERLDFARMPEAILDLEESETLYRSISENTLEIAEKNDPYQLTLDILEFYRTV